MPTAKTEIRDLYNTSVTNTVLVYEFNLYDESVAQKLWSTEYYLRNLQSLDINNYLVFPTTSGTISTGSVFIPHPLLDTARFCYEINRLLDGFFMNSMSTLDTLGHQIYKVYRSTTIPTKIYVYTAKDMLVREHPTSKLTPFLDSQLGSRWYSEFESFRHCTTHESLIRFEDIGIKYDPITTRYKLSKQIKLPDDPQVRPFTYGRNRKAIEYCVGLFGRIKTLVDKTYDSIIVDIRSNGNIVPI